MKRTLAQSIEKLTGELEALKDLEELHRPYCEMACERSREGTGLTIRHTGRCERLCAKYGFSQVAPVVKR